MNQAAVIDVATAQPGVRPPEPYVERKRDAYYEWLRHWMTAAKSSFDLGRIASFGLLLIAVATIFIRTGQLLNGQENLEKEMQANEQKRDLKDQMQVNSVNDLFKKWQDEKDAREKLERTVTRLHDLYLIKFGQSPDDDKGSK